MKLFLHAAHVVIHLAWTLAVSCCGADAWGSTWTGLRICVGDPTNAIRGVSDCAPCNRLVADVREYTRGLDWRVGLAEFSDGVPQDIAIVRGVLGEPTPYFEVVVQGETTRKVVGYKGDVESVIRLCPLPLKRVTLPAVKSVRIQSRQPVVVRSSGPTWTWPGDLRTHLAAEHGYSVAWLGTLSTAELRSLHDNSHNMATIRNYRTVQPAPVRYVQPQSYYRSQGVQAFGAPLFGTYQAGGCPGGFCP